MTLHQLYPAAQPLLPQIALPRLTSRLAADWWRLLLRHVAERHFLPRDRAPSEPSRPQIGGHRPSRSDTS